MTISTMPNNSDYQNQDLLKEINENLNLKLKSKQYENQNDVESFLKSIQFESSDRGEFNSKSDEINIYGENNSVQSFPNSTLMEGTKDSGQSTIKNKDAKTKYNEEDIGCIIDEGMGSNATIRVQKAKIKGLQDRLIQANQNKINLDEEIKKLKNRYGARDIEGEKMRKELSSLRKKFDRLEGDNEIKKNTIEELKNEVSQMRRELASSQALTKDVERERNSREVRLTRALGECERYKAQITRHAEARERDSGTNKKDKELLSRVKSLEKQRCDLLLVFKKQMKLIEILKRQKVHVEAAKLLSFTEEEFLSVLDWQPQ